MLDAAAFIGVGFDGRGKYSSDSRKQSVIQRNCANKAQFLDSDIPDNMNAFGVYDYYVHSNTYSSANAYVAYLREKAATSLSSNVFLMEKAQVSVAASAGIALPLFDVGGGVGAGTSSEKQTGIKGSNTNINQGSASVSNNQKKL